MPRFDRYRSAFVDVRLASACGDNDGVDFGKWRHLADLCGINPRLADSPPDGLSCFMAQSRLHMSKTQASKATSVVAEGHGPRVVKGARAYCRVSATLDPAPGEWRSILVAHKAPDIYYYPWIPHPFAQSSVSTSLRARVHFGQIGSSYGPPACRRDPPSTKEAVNAENHELTVAETQDRYSFDLVDGASLRFAPTPTAGKAEQRPC